MDQQSLRNSLKRWFVVHFILDVVAALPLFFFPTAFLRLLGWQAVDPFASRLVAAALFGIGIESWLGRHGDLRTFQHMLNLKIIWSAAAAAGMDWSMVQAPDITIAHWLVLGIFLIFHGVWVYFRRQVSLVQQDGALQGRK